MGIQISKVPLYQQAYELLRARIASGELGVGDRVDPQAIAEELSISRTPVRESIIQLCREGLLKLEKDGRARVHSPSVSELAEIYTVRASLEATAAAQVAARQPLPALSGLEQAIEQARAAQAAADWREVTRANTRFHEELTALSENQTIIRTLATLRIHVVRYRSLAMQTQERQEVAICGHSSILRLLRSGDSHGVNRLVYRHIIRAGVWAMRYMDAEQKVNTPAMQYLRQAGHLEGADDEDHQC